MDKKELKRQIKDLNEVLIEYAEHSPSIVEFALKIVTVEKNIERKLTDQYIKRFNTFDIHEALNIDIKEARKKLKNFDFTIKEKNIILDTFYGGAESFLKEYNGEVIN